MSWLATRNSLAAKLVRVTVLILLGLGAANLLLVNKQNRDTAKQNLLSIEEHIQRALNEKGRVLTESHALAMQSMVSDNAFGAIRELVYGVIREDDELVYGLFLDEQSQPWVYASPSVPPPGEDTALLATGDSNVWRELALVDELLEGDALAIRNVRLFGQDIIEFGIAVVVDDENLGTIRYGVSTQQMKAAVAVARSESQESSGKQLRILLGLLLATTLVGIVLIRRQAIRVTKPLEELTRAANLLAAGTRDVRVNVNQDSGGEVALLAGAFNKMVADLSASYLELEALNHDLEERVEARTEELAFRNRDMKKVFENVDQGFITLDRNGVMAAERSAVVDTWFGSYAPSTAFVEWMLKRNADFADQFDVAWDQLQDEILPPSMSIQLLPRSFAYDGREFAVCYLLLSEDEKGPEVWSGVLLVIADVTERIALEKVHEEQQEFARAVQGIANDTAEYQDFMREVGRLVKVVATVDFEDDPLVVKRALHTIKGNSRARQLTSVADLCHEIEEDLANRGGPPSGALVERLSGHWATFAKSIQFMLDPTDSPMIRISQETYDEHLAEVYDDQDLELFDRVFSWQLRSTKASLERLAMQARAYALRLDKHVDMAIETTAINIDAGYWAQFWSELTHVVLNAVDHGLPGREEDALERAVLVFRAQEAGEEFIVEIEDNGRGIDWSKIEAKARAQGLPSASEEDLVEAMFSDGLSSRDTQSQFSGRGIGMGAVRTQVQRMNGRIEVRSTLGRGTCFRFIFPRSRMRGALYERSVKTIEALRRMS